MKVLFLSAKLSSTNEISPIIYSQGESLKKKGIDLNYFTMSGPGFYKYITGIKKLKKHLQNNNYDLIHAHYSYCGFVAIRQKTIPVVTSLMGSDVISKWFSFKNIMDKIILKYVLKYSVIISKTEEINKKLNTKNNTYVIPNGINFNLFKLLNKIRCREILGLRNDKKYILFAANPNRKEKNYILAKQTIDLLNDKNIELLVVYNISQQDLVNYYNACDVLLVTSLYEGSINVVKESLACNLPVISTDVGDVRERIHGIDNCFITTLDKNDIAEKILITIKCNKKNNSREKLLNIKEDIIADRIIQIYKNTLLNRN